MQVEKTASSPNQRFNARFGRDVAGLSKVPPEAGAKACAEIEIHVLNAVLVGRHPVKSAGLPGIDRAPP
jgi:hypothetical protein